MVDEQLLIMADVKKAFLAGLFSGEFIFGGTYYWKDVSVSNGLGLTIKNSLKH